VCRYWQLWPITLTTNEAQHPEYISLAYWFSAGLAAFVQLESYCWNGQLEPLQRPKYPQTLHTLSWQSWWWKMINATMPLCGSTISPWALNDKVTCFAHGSFGISCHSRTKILVQINSMPDAITIRDHIFCLWSSCFLKMPRANLWRIQVLLSMKWTVQASVVVEKYTPCNAFFNSILISVASFASRICSLSRPIKGVLMLKL
jgi:hypothetical protein